MELGNLQTEKTVYLAQQQRALAAVQNKASTLDAAQLAKIDEAAQEFEAVFLTEMLRPMFEEVNKPDDTFGGGKGEEIFSNMMVDEYGKQMAERGGIGLARFVRDEMIRIQEAANGQ
ncbi:MAG: rod-binding protein [Alphaproteobacteria bacterium]|nr:rod-binding protein [Alphaproteobacteria bacterium]MBU0859751.1 rod-binding protein [Alphaproteobacteria bacterium]